MNEQKTKQMTKKLDHRTIGILVVSGAIVVAIVVISWQVVRMIKWQNASREGQMSVSGSGEMRRPRISDDENYVIDESLFEDEVSELMVALGIDDANELVSDDAYTAAEIEKLDGQYPNRQAPPVGSYTAVQLYEKGVPKDLQALAGVGRRIELKMNDDGTFTGDFLGVEMAGTYDDRYFHMAHLQPMPMFWNGEVLTAFVHRLQVELVAVEATDDSQLQMSGQ